jgi:mono/diheme cytochrome c family protein
MKRVAQTLLAAGLIGTAGFATAANLTAQGQAAHQGGSITTALVPNGPSPDMFANMCAMCHGVEGKGDGMAAAAFDPKPTNFADTEYQASKTDDELVQAISEGTGSMPAFGQQLSAEEIQSLVAYIRELGQ